MLARKHLEASEEAGQEPDMAMLEQVIAAMGVRSGG